MKKSIAAPAYLFCTKRGQVTWICKKVGQITWDVRFAEGQTTWFLEFEGQIAWRRKTRIRGSDYYFICESSLFRINQRYHGLGTRLWHTPPAAVKKTDGGKHSRARPWGERGQGQSLWIDLCVPPALPRTPCRAAPSLFLPPPPQSPGSHTLNSSHWALAWDAWSAGCIERRSPAWAARSAMCWRRAGGEVVSTLRVTLTPRWAFSA